MKKNILHLSLLVLFFLTSSLLYTIKAQVVLEAKDNAFVKGGVASDSNYYSDPSYLLRVRGSSGDDNKRKTYIKFDLSTVSQSFSKAELRITINRVVAITGGLINRADIFTVANDTWNEQSITWNTAPVRNNYLFTQEFAVKTSTMADTVYSLDLTSYVQSEYSGDKVVSICMVDTLSNGTDIRFWSNRSLLATGPQLVLTTGPVGTINVTSPVGGESWQVGSTHDIKWTSSNITNMKIDYSINNGASWVNVVASTPASANTYSWNIPPTNSSTQCKIRLSDADNTFTSSLSTGVFTILNNTSAVINVVSPVAGDKLIVGSTHNIVWTSSYVSNVKLEYSADNGSTWNNIIASKSASALSYPWSVPSNPSTQCKVRISDVVNSTVLGESPVFSIKPASQNMGILQANVFVKAGVSADSNYAADVLLRVRGSATVDNQRKTYLKFDISNFTGTAIDRAELKLTAYQVIANTSGPNRMDVFTVPTDGWNESSITWNNAPAKGDYIATQEFGTKSTTQPDTTYPIDVTKYVKNEFLGDKVVSFCLIDTSNNNTDIRLGSSRGFVQAPQLVLFSITGVNDRLNNIPGVFTVNQNYPNPFNPTTNISYSIPSSGLVKVAVYDILGNVVAVLANEVQKAGQHDLTWNASSLSSGVYFYRVQYADYNKTIKMILMK
jgi:hypothetical protein